MVFSTIIDVTAVNPPMPGIEREINVAGRNETVLRASQILRGKLRRIPKALNRDAFDLITAANTEPVALEIAFNALDADSRVKASLLKCVWVAAAPVLCLHSRGTASRSTRRASGSHRRDARSPAACC